MYFDYSRLFTSIPHQELKNRFTSVIRNAFIFKNGNRRYKYEEKKKHILWRSPLILKQVLWKWHHQDAWVSSWLYFRGFCRKGFKWYYAFFLVCCVCDTSYIVLVHIQCQASIYTLSLCRGHSWRVRLAKQVTLTLPVHLVSPLVCRVPWMSTVVLYCWCHSDGASVLLYFTFQETVGIPGNVYKWHSSYHRHLLYSYWAEIIQT